MKFEIVWSDEAERTYHEILVDLSEKWTTKEIESFIDRTEDVQNHLKRNPRMYAYSSEMKAHRAVLHKNVSLFYRIKSQEVQLITFWFNRQNPNDWKL